MREIKPTSKSCLSSLHLLPLWVGRGMGDRSTGGLGASSHCASRTYCTIQAEALLCPVAPSPQMGTGTC